MQGGLAGPARRCGLVLGRLPLAKALANHRHMKEADLQESSPEKAQLGQWPTSTFLRIFSLSGHLVLSQDSSFWTWDFPEGPQLLLDIHLTQDVLDFCC